MNNKEEYFEYSKANGVPMRCPLLDRCERRAHTLAITHGWSFSESCELAGMKQPIVESVADPAYKVGGASNFIVGGLCPEVSLFEGTVPVSPYHGIPVRRSQYDKYMNPQYELLETSHFLQCAEYVSAQQATSISPVAPNGTLKRYLMEHHQWLIGTVIAALAVLVAL